MAASNSLISSSFFIAKSLWSLCSRCLTLYSPNLANPCYTNRRLSNSAYSIWKRRSVARRIANATVLSVIREWLNVPVVEHSPQGERRSAEAKDRHRGTPQGGIISPLLANQYFRRFMLARYQHG